MCVVYIQGRMRQHSVGHVFPENNDWKNRRTRVKELLKRGVTRTYAVTTGCARKGPWRMSKVKWVNIALPDQYFKSLGLVFPWV